nr:protein G12 [Aedes albopictus]
MKRLFLLLSLLGVHLEFSFGDEPIRSELIQLHQSIPLDRLRILLAEYIVQDAQFRRSLQYMRSPEFAEVWNRFVNNEKVRVWLQYIDDAGLPVNKVLAMFTDFTGTARVKRFIQKRKGGLSAFVDDALKIVSSSEMVEFHEMQKSSNPQYKETIDKLTAPEFGQMMKDILEDPEVIEIQEQVRKHGIDIAKLVDLIKSFFGWNQIL